MDVTKFRTSEKDAHIKVKAMELFYKKSNKHSKSNGKYRKKKKEEENTQILWLKWAFAPFSQTFLHFVHFLKLFREILLF